VKLSVLGYPWQIKLLDPEEFKEKFGKGLAITDTDTQEIHIRSDEFTKRIVCHEIAHAFMHYACTEELNLHGEKAEEFFCDFIGIHGEEIIRLTKLVMRRLK